MFDEQDNPSIEQEAYAHGLYDGIKKHSWMKDGVTYVGNGTYTLKEAVEMMKKEHPDLDFSFILP